MDDGASGFISVSAVSASGVVTKLPSTASITWSSNAPEVVSVSSNGTVVGKQPGVAEITAETSLGVARLPVIVMPTPSDLRAMFDGNLLGTVGKSLPDSVAMRVVDRRGLPVAGVEVAFDVKSGNGSLSSHTAITAADGFAKVQWRLGTVAGANALTASSPGLDDAWVYATGEANGDEDQLQLIQGNNQTGVVDAILAQELVVKVVDKYGNPVKDASIRWSFADGGASNDGGGGSTSASASTSAQHTVAADAEGVARASWRLGTTAGRQTASVMVGLDGAEAWFEAEASSGSTRSVVLTPSVASIGVNEQLDMTGVALDQHGNVVTDQTVIWDVQHPTVASVDRSSGRVVGLKSGTTQVWGSADGWDGEATVTVMNTGPGRLLSVSGSGQSGAVSTTLSQPFIVRVLDASGGTLAGVNVTWAVETGGGSLAATTSPTDGGGYARVDYTLGSTAQLNRVTATVASLPAVTFSATATGGALASVSVSPATVSMFIGDQRQLVASALDGSGNGVGGATFQWSSSNPAAVSVDATGLIHGTTAGQATVTATSGGHSGSSTISVQNSAGSLSLDITSATLNAIGDTVRVTATGTDGGGNQVSPGSITWVSQTPNIVGVDGIGHIYTKGIGQGRVTASLGSQSATVTIDARQILASVSFTPSSPSVAAGSSLQMVAAPVDSNGVVLVTDQSAQLFWEGGNPGIATVTASGLVQGIAAGTASLALVWEASSSGQGQTLRHQGSIQVTTGSPPPGDSDPNPVDPNQPPPPPPPPYNPGVAPELPREYINTDYTAPSGNVIRVPSGGDLQGAIDQAQPGDQILLAAGGVYIGNFTLPVKSGSEWIVITTETGLPGQGTRLTPALASSANVARIESSHGFTATIGGAPGSHHYRLMGIEVTQGPNVDDQGEILGFGGGFANYPHHIIIDRVYVHGRTNRATKRCIGLSTAYGAVVDSYVDHCAKFGQDSQAILVWDGPGPIKVVNNYLAAAGENMMIGGGGDPSVNGLLPSDIEIRRNYFHKPDAWFYNPVGTVKNLFELKTGRRVLFEGNVLEGNWTDAQTGWGILIKSTNQYGACTWCVTEEVTMRYNIMRKVGNGISILRTNSVQATSGQTNNILIEHNILDAMGGQSGLSGDVSWGSGFALIDGPLNVTIRHNTIISEWHTILFAEQPTSGMVIADNIMTHGIYGIHSAVGSGSLALAQHMPNGQFVGNLIAGANAGQYPANNSYPSNVGAVGFTGLTNYTLSSSSPYKGLATDGTDPGADVNQVNAMTAGVR